MFTNINLTDVGTGYKVFRREVLSTIVLTEGRFGFEPEVTAKIAKGKWRVSYRGRTYEDGKKITWRDGYRGIWAMCRHNVLG